MQRRGIRRALVLGSAGVGQALRAAGIETVHTGEAGATEVGSVFVGWHPECGMKDIETACRAIWGGAELYVASDVPFFATQQGRTIGYSFAITAAIRRLTRAPMTLTGKPSVRALRFVAGRLGVPARELAVVGDDPLVEILMARRAGATALAVTTGTTRARGVGRGSPPRAGRMPFSATCARCSAGSRALRRRRRRTRRFEAEPRAGAHPPGAAARAQPPFKITEHEDVIDQALRGHPGNHDLRHRPGAPRLSPEHVLHVADEGAEPRALQGQPARVSG